MYLLKGLIRKIYKKIINVIIMSNYPNWLPKEQFEEVRREGENLSKELSYEQQADFIERISKAKTEDVLKELLSMDLTKGTRKIVRAMEGKYNRNEGEIDSGVISHESYLKELGYISKILFELVKPNNDLLWIPKEEMGLERRSKKILMIRKMSQQEKVEHTKRVGTYEIYMDFMYRKKGLNEIAKKLNLQTSYENYRIEFNEATNPTATMRRFKYLLLEKIFFPENSQGID
ncbi:MAG: hypothetical protein AB8B69_20375 [Chitinophagales bacterium]